MPDEQTFSERAIDGLPAFEVAQWALGEQFRAIEQLDSKAERVFGGALALVTLAAAGVTFVVGQGDGATSIVALIAAVPVVAAFSWTALFFVTGYRISGWKGGPQGAELMSVVGNYEAAQVRLWVAEELVDSYDFNRPRLQRKSEIFTSELNGLLAEIVLLLLGFGGVAAFRIITEGAG